MVVKCSELTASAGFGMGVQEEEELQGLTQIDEVNAQDAAGIRENSHVDEVDALSDISSSEDEEESHTGRSNTCLSIYISYSSLIAG